MCHNLGISSVNNLDLNFINNSSITCSSPSFYSDDIPQCSITTYHVIVKSKDGSIIVDVNTTDTFYQLPSNFIEYCHSYIVSVRAIIEQYSLFVATTIEQNIGSKIILIIYYYKILLHYQIILLTYLTILWNFITLETVL